jgi:hypothetical protein
VQAGGPRDTLLRIQVRDAFSAVAIPPPHEILAERYRAAVDPGELLAAFRDKHWTQVPVKDLFHHRESLVALSAVGYHAYIGAYLTASLSDGPYTSDLREVTLFSLRPPVGFEQDAAELRERLSSLDSFQRLAIGGFVRYLADDGSREAQKILPDWA